MGIIDLLLLAVLGGVTYCVASEGSFGAAIMAVTVLVAGLLAMNFFEPLAAFLGDNVATSNVWRARWDVIALVGLFAGIVVLLRVLASKIAQDDLEVHPLLHELGRWGFGLLTGYVTMAFLLTALHTAVLPREFLGFSPDRRNLLNVVAPDRQWLGFVQYATEKPFSRSQTVVVDGETRVVKRVFDGAYFDVPGQNNEYWPSFPIRYATRRENLAGGPTAPAPSRPSTGGKDGKDAGKSGEDGPPDLPEF